MEDFEIFFRFKSDYESDCCMIKHKIQKPFAKQALAYLPYGFYFRIQVTTTSSIILSRKAFLNPLNL
jgi:hypothetical protein